MTRHRLEYAVFRELRSSWLTGSSGGACLRLIARTDALGNGAAYLTDHPEELPRFSDKLCLDDGNLLRFTAPHEETRYLCLLVEDLAGSGQFLLTSSPSELVAGFEDEVVHPGYLAELEEKRLRSIEYLKTPAIEWLRRLAPITGETISLILTEPRLYHARCAASRASFMGGMFGGDGLVPLGVWATLWQRGEALFPCPSCGGNVHAFHAARGLSVGRRGGFCDRCGSYATEQSTASVVEVRKLLESLPHPAVRPYRIDRAVETIDRELRRDTSAPMPRR